MSEANKKYVTIGVVGMIPEIRVNGPLKTPHYIDLEMVKAMVIHGRRVYEHNPAKPSERILLTIENMDKDNFGKDTRKEPEKTPAVESVPETPVAPVVNEDPAPQEPEAPVDPEPAVKNAPADELETVVDQQPAEEDATEAPVDPEHAVKNAPADEPEVESETPVVDPVPETPVVEATQNSNKNQKYNGKKNNKKK